MQARNANARNDAVYAIMLRRQSEGTAHVAITKANVAMPQIKKIRKNLNAVWYIDFPAYSMMWLE